MTETLTTARDAGSAEPGVRGLRANAIAAALAKAGAGWTPLYRREKDAQGLPSGEPVRVGCLLGRHYRKTLPGGVIIGLPGMLASTAPLRFEGVRAHGCPVPEPGDIIDGCRVTEVCGEGAPFYVLALEEA